MHLIKLDAIGSTNDYLKQMSRVATLANYTTVAARSQTAGKGQRGNSWQSEPGKNLTMSVFVRMEAALSEVSVYLNAAVSTAVSHALQQFGIPALSLKWPNDIMSGKKKIGGILIENSVRNAAGFDSVIGIGLNVNQTQFDGLPGASSLRNVAGREFDLDELCSAIVRSISQYVERLPEDRDLVWQEYDRQLFLKDVPAVFRSVSGTSFNGIIRTVGRDGELKVLLADGSEASFGIKQVTLLS